MANRVQNQDDLDRLVEAWTIDNEAFAPQERLQKPGMPRIRTQAAGLNLTSVQSGVTSSK